MIVLDASAATDFVLRLGDRAAWVGDRLAAGSVHAPALIDLEVVAALRRLRRCEEVGAARAATALDDLAALPIRRWPHVGLVARVWQLRDALSAHDATYVALAEVLDAPVVTTDAGFATAAHGARVECFPG